MSRPLTNSPAVPPAGEPHDESDARCDLCGTPIYKPTPYGRPSLTPAIRREYGSAASVQVSLTIGEQESDWGAGETTLYTVCPACFEHKLMDWFATQGAVPKVTSWDN